MTALFFLQKPLPCERGLLCPGLLGLHLLEKTVSPTAGLSHRLKGCSMLLWHHFLSSPISISNMAWKNKMLQVLCCFRYYQEIQFLADPCAIPVYHPPACHLHASDSRRLRTDPWCNAGWLRAQVGRLPFSCTQRVRLTLLSKQH